MKKLLLVLSASLLASTAFAATEPVKGELGNHCALGLTQGKQVQTDCKINWKDEATNKVYCFGNEQAKNEWAKDTKANIEKANTEYNKVLASSAKATAPKM